MVTAHGTAVTDADSQASETRSRISDFVQYTCPSELHNTHLQVQEHCSALATSRLQNVEYKSNALWDYVYPCQQG